jgi:hypothetical protein
MFSKKAYQPPVPESSSGLHGRWRFFMVATTFQNGYKSAKALLPHQQVAQSHRQQIKAMLPNRVVGYTTIFVPRGELITITGYFPWQENQNPQGRHREHSERGLSGRSHSSLTKTSGVISIRCCLSPRYRLDYYPSHVLRNYLVKHLWWDKSTFATLHFNVC